MSEKVKHYLILDSIGLAINIFVTMLLCYFCSLIEYAIIALILKLIVVFISVCIDIFITFFFLLYWWSDIKWTQCKQNFRRMKRKFHK